MANPTVCQVGDAGTIFRQTIKDQDGTVVPIGFSTTRTFLFRRPDRTTVTRDAVLSSDGSDGQMEYATVADDFALPGLWKVQGFVEIPGGSWHTTDIHQFTVAPNLDD